MDGLTQSLLGATHFTTPGILGGIQNGLCCGGELRWRADGEIRALSLPDPSSVSK